KHYGQRRGNYLSRSAGPVVGNFDSAGHGQQLVFSDAAQTAFSGSALAVISGHRLSSHDWRSLRFGDPMVRARASLPRMDPVGVGHGRIGSAVFDHRLAGDLQSRGACGLEPAAANVTSAPSGNLT